MRHHRTLQHNASQALVEPIGRAGPGPFKLHLAITLSPCEPPLHAVTAHAVARAGRLPRWCDDTRIPPRTI